MSKITTFPKGVQTAQPSIFEEARRLHAQADAMERQGFDRVIELMTQVEAALCDVAESRLPAGARDIARREAERLPATARNMAQIIRGVG